MKMGYIRNGLVGLTIARSRIEKVGEIKMEVKQHFDSIFKVDVNTPILDGVNYKQLTVKE